MNLFVFLEFNVKYFTCTLNVKYFTPQIEFPKTKKIHIWGSPLRVIVSSNMNIVMKSPGADAASCNMKYAWCMKNVCVIMAEA